MSVNAFQGISCVINWMVGFMESQLTPGHLFIDVNWFSLLSHSFGFQWVISGKIVFAAPSRPLVMQQIEACHNTVGIPQVKTRNCIISLYFVLMHIPKRLQSNRLQEWTIDMTGQMNPQKRSQFWKSKRVFFVTPQVLEKDILSGDYARLQRHLLFEMLFSLTSWSILGICPVKQLICLVIDEAHRAMGNYSYCVAVREACFMTTPIFL